MGRRNGQREINFEKFGCSLYFLCCCCFCCWWNYVNFVQFKCIWHFYAAPSQHNDNKSNKLEFISMYDWWLFILLFFYGNIFIILFLFPLAKPIMVNLVGSGMTRRWKCKSLGFAICYAKSIEKMRQIFTAPSSLYLFLNFKPNFF